MKIGAKLLRCPMTTHSGYSSVAPTPEVHDSAAVDIDSMQLNHSVVGQVVPPLSAESSRPLG